MEWGRELVATVTLLAIQVKEDGANNNSGRIVQPAYCTSYVRLFTSRYHLWFEIILVSEYILMCHLYLHVVVVDVRLNFFLMEGIICLVGQAKRGGRARPSIICL